MVTFTLFICLIQIQNTEIYCKSAKKYQDIFAHIAQPYFEETCICQTDTQIQQKMTISKQYRSWISDQRTPSMYTTGLTVFENKNAESTTTQGHLNPDGPK